jgi:Bacterial regulatory helix-turn-helix protein, lysR family
MDEEKYYLRKIFTRQAKSRTLRVKTSMELRLLRYFLALAEHQSFRKPALSLRVGHPSLCAQIIDREKEIGTRLFERTNQRVSLTTAGPSFISGEPVAPFPLSLVWDSQGASPLVNDFLSVVRHILPKSNGALGPNNNGRSFAPAVRAG